MFQPRHPTQASAPKPVVVPLAHASQPQPQGSEAKWRPLESVVSRLPSLIASLNLQDLTMHSRRANRPDHLRTSLGHELGYPDYPSNHTAEPYLNYIANRHIGRGALEEYLKLFIRVVEHFSQPRRKRSEQKSTSNTVRALLDELISCEDEDLFRDTKAGSSMRKEYVEDTVMYIMGVWSMMLSSFVQLPNGVRKVVTAYNLRVEDKGAEFYDESMAGLVKASRLLPAPFNDQRIQETNVEDEVVHTAMKLIELLGQTNSALKSTNGWIRSPSDPYTLTISKGQISDGFLDAMDSLESLSVKATRLNAFTLHALGAVTISWTHNISRHMLLSRHGGRHILEVFALPCVFSASSITSGSVGISSELAQEIQESYCILFNAWPDRSMHANAARFLGIRKFCWCWSCSAYRYRKNVISKYRQSFHAKSGRTKRNCNVDLQSEYDPLLIQLMNGDGSSDWTQDLFPCLWSRITVLEEHLQVAKPWSIWILFRDRRDTLQFWTFFFATIVVFLTFLQVALGVAQVVGSFN